MAFALMRKGEPMRLIDADALIDKLKLYANGSVIGMIEQAPTIDAVSVVRRKDCVHGTDRTEDFQEEGERWDVVNPIVCMMYSSDGVPDFFPKDNYCGFGERKTDSYLEYVLMQIKEERNG